MGDYAFQVPVQHLGESLKVHAPTLIAEVHDSANLIPHPGLVRQLVGLGSGLW